MRYKKTAGKANHPAVFCKYYSLLGGVNNYLSIDRIKKKESSWPGKHVRVLRQQESPVPRFSGVGRRIMFILFKHRGESMSRLRVMSVFLIFIITQLRVFVNKNSQFTYYTQPGTFAKLKNIEKSQAVTINERRNRQACP